MDTGTADGEVLLIAGDLKAFVICDRIDRPPVRFAGRTERNGRGPSIDGPGTEGLMCSAWHGARHG